MSLVKNQAILLKSKKYKERDKLLTFLTEENGKIQALCKGARVPLNKWGSSTEPPNFSYIQLYQKGDFFTLTEIQVEEIFLNIISNFQRLIIFSYIANIIDSLLLSLFPSKSTFYLALSSIYALNRREINPTSIGYIFALKFLDVQGYLPEISKCVICGRKENKDFKEFILSFEEGGIICETCAKFAHGETIKLDYSEISFLKSIMQIDLKDISSIKELEIENYENLDRIISGYYDVKFKRKFTSITELTKKYNKRSKVL